MNRKFTIKATPNFRHSDYRLYKGDKRKRDMSTLAIRTSEQTKQPLYSYLDGLDQDVVLFDQRENEDGTPGDYDKKHL